MSKSKSKPIALPAPMTVAQAVKQHILSEVYISGYGYAVDWGNDVSPRIHSVSKSRMCGCYLGDECPSVESIKVYLQAGGQRAPDYPETFWATVPEKCPVCGEACEAYPDLDFTEHGVGWRCSKGETYHYWQARAVAFQKATKNPWLFKPVVKDGVTIYAGVSLEDHYAAWNGNAHFYYLLEE